MSDDGNVLAVGAYFEDGPGAGVNNMVTDTSLYDNYGAVYVYRYANNAWSEEAYIKASTLGTVDFFGSAISLSGDGNTLAVGVSYDDSNSTTINGDESNNLAFNSGAAYIFRYATGAWSQQAYIKPSNTGILDQFGFSVSLSNDGNTLAVGAQGEDGDATTINGTSNDLGSDSGAAYVFRFSNTGWAQEAYIKASNSGPGDLFGFSVSLSADGNTLAVGAATEDSDGTSPANDLSPSSGAAYIYKYENSVWTEQAYIKPNIVSGGVNFGRAVSLNDSGDVLALGAHNESSNATGINGDQNNTSTPSSGALYVFKFDGSSWLEQTYIKSTNPDQDDQFGISLSLSGDGETLAVSAPAEDSNATGINGDQADNNANAAGAVYLY